MARIPSRWLVVAAAVIVALTIAPRLGYAAEPDTERPSTPGTPVATFPASGSVTLTWTASTDNVGVTGYDVQQIYTDIVQLRTTTTNSLTIPGLNPSATYRFSVRARDAAGNISPLSDSVKVTMPPGDVQPPSTPTGLTASDVTASQATLSWTRSTDNVIVEAYEVFRIAPSGNTLFATTFSYPGPPSSIRLTGLTTATTYRFAVRARDAVGNVSGLSSEVSFTPGGTPPTPACVATYRVVAQWPGGFQAEISITAATPINGWTITFTFPSGQIISHVWGGIRSQNGSTVIIRNDPWNAAIPPTRTIGFQATWTGSNAQPSTITCTSP